MGLDINKGEWDVIARLANGYERKDIAKELGVSVSTVNNRIYAAMDRTHSKTSYQLVARYVHDTYAAASRPRGPESDD